VENRSARAIICRVPITHIRLSERTRVREGKGVLTDVRGKMDLWLNGG